MAHGRLSNTGLAASWIAVDIVRLEDGVFAEHWDVLQFEATAEESEKRAADVRRRLADPGLTRCRR